MTTARLPSGVRRVLVVAGPGVAVIAVILVIWQFGSSHVAGNGLLLPSPIAVVRSLVTDGWMIFPALGTTVASSLWALLWGCAIGAGTAVLAAVVRPIRALVTRQLTLVFCLPLAAIAPLLFLLSTTPGPEIIMGTIACVFPVFNAVLQGLTIRHRRWEEMLAVLGGSRVRYFVRIQVPAATGNLLTAARLAVPATILGVTLAEYFGGDQGIGALMISSISNLEAARAYALGLVITLVCSLSYIVVALVERLLPWVREVADA
jgi:ABC-type nitrate/sulfonate/bicarbonate transport system permease component